jgi:DNA-directed RNA polymerase specialized sigma24 family protein
LTTTEVGDALGMSRPAVKSAQSRAYKRLRDLLASPEGASS